MTSSIMLVIINMMTAYHNDGFANHHIIVIKTCHDDGLAKVFQHEGQGGAGVGEGVRPVQNNKPHHHCHDYEEYKVGEDEDEDVGYKILHYKSLVMVKA